MILGTGDALFQGQQGDGSCGEESGRQQRQDKRLCPDLTEPQSQADGREAASVVFEPGIPLAAVQRSELALR